MPAWFLLPAAAAAVGAIGKYAAHKQRQPIKQRAFRQKANTGYLRKYMSDLQGRSASRARTELAMRPALRAIGAQQAQGQRQLEYQAAQQGLEGSGIEAQKQLALQAGTTQAVAGLGEKLALSAQSKAQQLQAAKEGQRMKVMGEIGQREAAVSEANRAAQFQSNEQFRLAKEQHEQQRKALITEGITNVATSAMQGIGKHEMGKIAETKAADLTTEQMNFQLQLLGLQGKAEGGVAGVPKKGYQPGGVAQEDELVEFLGNTQGYQQALQNYQTQQNEARAIQHEDKTKQFNLYQSKLDQITDIESSRKTKTNTATGQVTTAPLARSQKNKIKKLKKDTEVEVLQPEELKPYELTESDSSAVAKDYLMDLAGRGIVTPEGFAKSFKNFREKKAAAIEMDVENTMTNYYEQASDPDQAVNSDEIFTTLRDPNFMKSKNFKTYRTSLVKVLNDQQADIEKAAGAAQKVADARGTIKREIEQNVHSLAPFLKTAKKIPAVTGKPATRTSEAVKGTPAYYDIKDNFQDVLAEMKHMIAAGEGGIPEWTYDEILARVKEIVDDLTIPLSQLQDISEEDKKKFSMFEDKKTGAWQIEGGDAKFKRIMVEELTKDLSKAVMWDDNASVEGEDKDGDETHTTSSGIEYKVK
jgi:hypothetical protein